ncbi:ABC transporter permease [Aquamicrobium zhengzhouense]|uniref:ABC transporter permease n=1 Tax=Aquamicrobium zhengzhouense TaxID=2781738 RepID=A0ABS0SDG2_9HYPH|nr:ABC transporter permease [Aquamicrobium zhengzhouense]MBI1621333.1 ABC transporter permease [Aquamicrobium zhengzhouense]
MANPATSPRGIAALHVDKLGLLVALLTGWGLGGASFATFRANRIVQGSAVEFWNALPSSLALAAMLGIVAAAAAGALGRSHLLRLASGLAGLIVVLLLIGTAAGYLTSEGDKLARVSPAAGFWLLVIAFALLIIDALSRLSVKPLVRLVILAAFYLVFGLGLAAGLWDDLSLLKEYSTRAASFWAEGRNHLVLAMGSMAAAILAGIPIGLVCYALPATRSAILNILNTIQTIPSMAMFTLLIAPLGWIATNIPGASELGIRGIGTAPAFVALFLYSLLPVVANTVAGLAGVPHNVRDAARGTGMTAWQRLARVDFPLALPTILTGIRIVLVQNIGLVTIAALIGGGGYGVFVFQGLGQMATDLVLLGALPTVLLAVSAAVVLDAVIEAASSPGAQGKAE